jgi:hypothetical protein
MPTLKLDDTKAELCKRIYKLMREGFSQNAASREVGRPSSWASEWLPVYLTDCGDLDLSDTTTIGAVEIAILRLNQILADVYTGEGKVRCLFSKHWKCSTLSEVNLKRASFLHSLYGAKSQLEAERRELLKASKRLSSSKRVSK